MTDTQHITALTPGTGVINRMFQDEALFTYTGLALLLLCIPTFLLMYVDTRTFEGINVWIKPLKFHISVGLFLLTLAFLPAFYLKE